MISCILLSAGESRRFGSPKALARLNQETVIEHIQNTLLSTTLAEIVIVLGYHCDEIKPLVLEHKRIRFVYNKDHKLGQTSSFQCGVAASDPQANGFMLLPVDFPLVLAKTIDLLISTFKEHNPELIIPVYQGRKGHPPIFQAKLKSEILALDHSFGLNTIANHHVDATVHLDCDDAGTIKTFNTQEELELLKSG